ncbi:hypothetical protein ACFL56_03765 [Candidatus Margulisiibacteriota bacterium]
MKKRYILILILVVILLFVWQVKFRKKDYESYTNKVLHYSVSYPKNWTYREFDSKTGAGFRKARMVEGIQNEFIVVEAYKSFGEIQDIPLKVFAYHASDIQKENVLTYNASTKVETDSGLEGYQVNWLYLDYDKEKKVTLPVTFFPSPSASYKAFYISLHDEKYWDVYEDMVRSFRIQ